MEKLTEMILPILKELGKEKNWRLKAHLKLPVTFDDEPETNTKDKNLPKKKAKT